LVEIALLVMIVMKQLALLATNILAPLT